MGICGSTDKAQSPSKEGKSQSYSEGRPAANAQTQNANGIMVSPEHLVKFNPGAIRDHYSFLSPSLGKGAYGEVRKAKNLKSGVLMAVKIISKRTAGIEEENKLKEEINMLKKLDHPNIIRVHEFFQDKYHLYIVTELCTGGELFDRIIQMHHFNEKKAKETMTQLLSAVAFCHNLNIVHRDLKPENILYESPDLNANLKIIDFGTASAFQKGQFLEKKLGTPYYIAPEVINKKYDEKCDIWSLGVILYILLSGTPPFNGPNDKEIMERARKGHYSMDIPELKKISNNGRDLITKMLTYEPTKRISAAEALNHPWFTDSTNETTNLDNTFKKLTHFRFQSKFQQIVCYYIANNLSSVEEKARMLKAFQDLDKNKDGQLSKEEMKKGLENCKDFNSDVIEEIFRSYDTNYNGYINYSEFVNLAFDREKMLTNERVTACFNMFDKDGSGKINAAELKEMLCGVMHGNQSDAVWNEIIAEVDKNKDGEIELSEFKEMLLHISK